MKFRNASAGVAMSVVLLSGCSVGDATSDSAEPVVPAIPASVDLATFTMPLDSSLYDMQEHRLLDRARSVLTTQCLTRFGFRITPPKLPEVSRRDHIERYGLDDADAAQRYGYHPKPEARTERPQEPTLSAAAYAVMHGEVAASKGQDVPKGGCLGEARARLESVDQNSVARPNKLAGEAEKLARQDSRVVAAIKQWSDCMSTRGYRYGDPWEVNDDERWQEVAIATPEEIQVAVADVACKKSANLIAVWAMVEFAYQQRLVDKNAEPLQVLQDRMDTELRNAAAVLAAGR